MARTYWIDVPEHLRRYGSVDTAKPVKALPKLSQVGDLEERLSRPVSSLKLYGLPLNTVNRLMNYLTGNISIRTIGDLVRFREQDLGTIKYMRGDRTIREIKKELKRMGLGLGMNIGKKELDPVAMKNLWLSIEDLELSTRTTYCLRGARIWIVLDLVKRTGPELLGIGRLGKKGVKEIEGRLDELGLSLCMNVKAEDAVPARL